MTITPSVGSQLPLADVRMVTFYKRDELTSDLICCDVEVGDTVLTFHEESTGWTNLIEHLSRLPDFRADWYGAVVSPPFASSETIAFQRR